LVLWGQRAARAGDRQIAHRLFLLALKLDRTLRQAQGRLLQPVRMLLA
jgi:hypothetical protein